MLLIMMIWLCHCFSRHLKLSRRDSIMDFVSFGLLIIASFSGQSNGAHYADAKVTTNNDDEIIFFVEHFELYVTSTGISKQSFIHHTPKHFLYHLGVKEAASVDDNELGWFELWYRCVAYLWCSHFRDRWCMFLLVLCHGNLKRQGHSAGQATRVVLVQSRIIIHSIFHLDKASFQCPLSLLYINFAIILDMIPTARRHCKSKASLSSEWFLDPW